MGTAEVFQREVDAGHIAFIKRSYIESFGPPRTNGRYIKVPKGRQEVTVHIPKSWRGPKTLVNEFDLKEDTEFYLGDSCYIINPDQWGEFIKKTNCIECIPATEGIVVNTGGDGYFNVRLSIRNLDSESN